MENLFNKTARILMVGFTPQTGEQVLSHLHDSEFIPRIHNIHSKEDFQHILSRHIQWDLIFISLEEIPNNLSPEIMLTSINSQGADIPAILISKECPQKKNDKYILQGIKQVIEVNNKDLLIEIMTRELDNLDIRRQYYRMSVALNVYEQNRRALIDDQIDPSVYIYNGIISYANVAFYKLINYSLDDSLSGISFNDLIDVEDKKNTTEILTHAENSGEGFAALEYSLNVNNLLIPVSSIVSPTSFKGKFCLNILIKLSDSRNMKITKKFREKSKQELKNNYKKEDFIELLNKALQKIIDHQETYFLLCISIDNLQVQVHKGSNEFYRKQYWKEVVDYLLLGVIDFKYTQWSVNQILILIPTDKRAYIKSLSNKILSIAKNITENLKDQDIFMVSLGAVLINDDSMESELIITQAQRKCKHAKELGGNHILFYDHKNNIERCLLDIVSYSYEQEKMNLYYQPILNIKNSDIGYYEANLILTDARGRYHSSNMLRNKLSHNDLWKKIDYWQYQMVLKALNNSKKLPKIHGVFIRLGDVILKHIDMLSLFTRNLLNKSIEANKIIFELSEKSLVKSNSDTKSFLQKSRSLGFQVAISEFGCSLSPLKIISDISVDFIKLDSSLYDDLIKTTNEKEEVQDIVQNLVSKGYNIIVPSIKSTSDIMTLWNLGVHLVQGDSIQKPLSTMNYEF